MLFTKPLESLRAEDVVEFCRKFRENIRVEYKSSFDSSVKKKIPAIISSFVNSYGGVLVIGVETQGGSPIEPIAGTSIDDPEPRLTIENICRETIAPEVIPEIAVVDAADNKKFVVVSIDESKRAPHVIESSRKVYVRTGDSQNPFDLAASALLKSC